MKTNKVLRTVNIILGLVSVGFFIYDWVLLSRIRPLMESWGTLTERDTNLLMLYGIGLLVLVIYYGLTLVQIMRSLRHSEKLPVGLVLVFILTAIAALFVVSVVVLMMDINNQFEGGLAQPEWSLVYPIMAAQLAVTLLLLALHAAGVFTRASRDSIAQDVNIFMIVQVVGVVCGGMGFGMTMLGFFYPKSWNPLVHTVMGSVVLLIPYLLMVGYWLVMKMGEKAGGFFDEKQTRDVGRSSFLTLIVASVLMVALFITQFNALDGVVKYIWLPLYLFGVIFLFSASNLVFSKQA
ncbi:MAG: hypothetical protein H0S79_17945 [Anaerolineaceae bacterium]|nr:hypothetical protein [Anaerolineaceae bacterium]